MVSKSPPEDAANVLGIIVTYRPDHQDLLRLVEAIRPQLDALLIVDNGDGSGLPCELAGRDTSILCLGANRGIAAAHNAGIAEAVRRGSSFVLLLDQDSLPAADMVDRLMEAYLRLKAEGQQVAATGPAYIDQRQTDKHRGPVAPFVYRDGLRLRRRSIGANADPVPADFLIASGCLIPLPVIEHIGTMTEELFIDYVDIEWGLRAGALGYRSFGVPAARMQHALGDGWINWMGKQIPVHRPLRHYYMIRNAVWLAFRPWIGWRWRWILFRRIAVQLIFFSLFVPGRHHHAAMMLKGLWHGLIRRMGCIDGTN